MILLVFVAVLAALTAEAPRLAASPVLFGAVLALVGLFLRAEHALAVRKAREDAFALFRDLSRRDPPKT